MSTQALGWHLLKPQLCACSLWDLHSVASRRFPFPCRVHTEFQSFRITFGKVHGSPDASAPSGDDRAIRTLREIAEEHPDVADAARYAAPQGVTFRLAGSAPGMSI